ncbi:MAG: transporter [Clostridiales bacterium]|nr:transporter [Clostridiales bacterium]
MGILILVLSGLLVFQGYQGRQSKLGNPDIIEKQVWESDEAEASNEPSISPASIKVYVTGKVRHPGVIVLQEGDRVTDAIDLAGGCLPEADLNAINMALKVKDEGMYYVPSIGEEIPIDIQTNISGAEIDGKVNINSADQSLLETLPGIGPSKAQKILEYREINGNFKSIEEIMNISGIGEKTYENLKDLIAIP